MNRPQAGDGWEILRPGGDEDLSSIEDVLSLVVRVDGSARCWQRIEDEDRCYDVCMQEETGLKQSVQIAGQTGLAMRRDRVEVQMMGLELELELELELGLGPTRDLAGRIA